MSLLPARTLTYGSLVPLRSTDGRSWASKTWIIRMPCSPVAPSATTNPAREHGRQTQPPALLTRFIAIQRSNHLGRQIRVHALGPNRCATDTTTRSRIGTEGLATCWWLRDLLHRCWCRVCRRLDDGGFCSIRI